MTVTTPVETRPGAPETGIYANSNARKVLQFLLRSPRTPVAPEILPTDEIHYPMLQPFVPTLGAAEMNALLDQMVKAGVLVADLVDKTPACPECGSPEVSTRYLCPKCHNYDIERSFLYEHLKCGKVASDDTFRKGSQLICPKCQAVLHNFGVEYRAVGAWYKCGNCSESFNAPAHSHFCRPKHHQFTLDRTRLVPVYQYRLNPAALSEVRREILKYEDAIALMEAMGLTVFAPSELRGKSGVPQSFDIVATSKGRWGEKNIAVDVYTSDSPLEIEPIRYFAAKVREAKPSANYLIAVPGLSDDARVLAKNMKIGYVEGATLKEATTALLNQKTFKELAA
jgi:hypothetical protein